MDCTDVVFRMILHGGNARSLSMEAIAHAKRGEFDSARQVLQQAAAELRQAHQVQTSLLHEEASGEAGGGAPVTLLMVHAQDHLMNAMTVKELAAEFVDLYEHMCQRGGMQP
jgi:PTS system cellobiose-specific IIA component